MDKQLNRNTRTMFVTVTQHMSDVMLRLRREGERVLTSRGGVNQEGVQGWTLLIQARG